MLYQADIAALDAARTIDMHWGAEAEPDETVRAFAQRLVELVLTDREEIDGLLAELSHNWPLDRLGAVDRNVMRIAVAELRGEAETPAAVIIDEAVELAKEFGDVDSGAFVNGILESARRRLRQGSAASGREQEP